jgi:hypothetical protein
MDYNKKVTTKSLIYDFYQKLLEIYNSVSEAKMVDIMERLVDVLDQEMKR